MPQTKRLRSQDARSTLGRLGQTLLSGVAVGTALFTGPAAVPGQEIGRPTEAHAGLKVLRDTWTSAYEDGNHEAMQDLYVEDAVRMPYDAPAVEGRTAIIGAYRVQFQTRSMFPTIRLLPCDIVIEGDVAIERGSYRELLVSRDGSRRVEESGKYVSIARRLADDSWRYSISIFNRDGPRAVAGGNP